MNELNAEIIEKIEDCELTIIKYKRMEEIKKQIRELENTDINELIDNMEERYEELLDECYPDVQIGDYSFSPSEILRKLDPTTFRCGCADYADSLASNIKNLAEWDEVQEQIDTLQDELEELEE